jgi:hypothetical protein
VNQSEHFRDGKTGKYVIRHVNGKMVDGYGRNLRYPIQLHTDWYYDLFTRTRVNYEHYRGTVQKEFDSYGNPYLAAAMQTAAGWEYVRRPRYFTSAAPRFKLPKLLPLEIPEFNSRRFGGSRPPVSLDIESGWEPHDYQLPALTHMRLGNGIKRGEMFVFNGDSVRNFSHMRAALEWAREPWLVQATPRYPNASPMLETAEDLERLDMMHAGLIPYPKLEPIDFSKLPAMEHIRAHVNDADIADYYWQKLPSVVVPSADEMLKGISIADEVPQTDSNKK